MRLRVNRLGLKLSLLASLFILSIVGAMTWILLRQIERAMISEMQIRANFFARSCAEAIFPRLDSFTLHFNTQEMLKEKAVVYVSVLDAEGKVLSHSDPHRIGETLSSPTDKVAIASSQSIVQEYTENGVGYFDIASPVLAGSRRAGTVRLGFTRASIANAIQDARDQILWIAFAAVLLAVFGTIFLVEWMTHPLPQLAQAAEEVGAGHLDVRIDVESRDEVGQLASAFNKMVAGLREKNKIRNTFGRYISKEVVDGFLSGKLSLELGGERKEMSVLMSDIRDFTELSEKLPPEEVVRLLNRYLTEMVHVITTHGGTVDKFIGDAILAVFGWPLYRQDHVAMAVDAGLSMQEKLAELNASFAREGKPPLKMGIAIHTGVAVAGNIGSQEKMQYTVIGDSVNLASRMEGANKRLGTDFIVSEAVYKAVEDRFEFKDVGVNAVRGRKEPVHIYSVLGRRASALAALKTAGGAPEQARKAPPA